MGQAKRRRRQLARFEIEPQFARQLSFLQRSADSFDVGFEDEAVRIANVVRLLLHDTGHSRSLLGQLGGIPAFWDSSAEFDAANLMNHSGLVAAAMGKGGAKFIAPLDDIAIKQKKSFDVWWNAEVFVIVGTKQVLTRRDLILVAANQDGGAHVDPELDEVYYELSHCNGLGWQKAVGDGPPLPVGSPIFPAIRQIAHEALKTLVWGYTCTRPDRYDVLIWNTVAKPVES